MPKFPDTKYLTKENPVVILIRWQRDWPAHRWLKSVTKWCLWDLQKGKCFIDKIEFFFLQNIKLSARAHTKLRSFLYIHMDIATIVNHWVLTFETICKRSALCFQLWHVAIFGLCKCGLIFLWNIYLGTHLGILCVYLQIHIFPNENK